MYDLITALSAQAIDTVRDLGLANMIVLFGMVASLATPLVLNATRMDRKVR